MLYGLIKISYRYWHTPFCGTFFLSHTLLLSLIFYETPHIISNPSLKFYEEVQQEKIFCSTTNREFAWSSRYLFSN